MQMVNINLLYIFVLGNMNALLLSKVSPKMLLFIDWCNWIWVVCMLCDDSGDGTGSCSKPSIRDLCSAQSQISFSCCTNEEQINKDLRWNRLCCLLLVSSYTSSLVFLSHVKCVPDARDLEAWRHCVLINIHECSSSSGVGIYILILKTCSFKTK